MYKLKYDFAHSADDLLDQADAIAAFLGDQIGESVTGIHLGNRAAYGLVVILELQRSLIKTATTSYRKQAKKQAKDIATTARNDQAAKNLKAYFSADTSDADRAKLEDKITQKQLERACQRRRHGLDQMEPIVADMKMDTEFAESLLEKRRAAA